MGRIYTILIAGALGLTGLAACSDMAPHPGCATYQNYCAGCHGRSGMGDGPMAEGLPVPPADLTMLKEANGGVFPTEDVMLTVHGYPGKHDTSVMPEFGPLLSGPKQIWISPKGEETMTSVALLELADYVETLQR